MITNPAAMAPEDGGLKLDITFHAGSGKPMVQPDQLPAALFMKALCVRLDLLKPGEQVTIRRIA